MCNGDGQFSKLDSESPAVITALHRDPEWKWVQIDSPTVRPHLGTWDIWSKLAIQMLTNVKLVYMPAMSQSRDVQNKSYSALTAQTAQAEMAQAFKDLARGEQQAAAIEANLASLESKLDALLASIEANDSAEMNGNTDAKTQKDQAPEEKQK
ncbi:hypothetical protein CHU98_g587 [Xylaria longipes]|nr:hypothetical protein CHU98_g587 [Xylaria longipes]